LNATETRYVDSTNGCNCAYRKSVIVEVGNFDPRAIGAEEIELEWRILRSGYLILYTPFARIVHNKTFDFVRFCKWLYRLGKDRACVTQLHWCQMITGRAFRPILPPAIALAVFSPVIFALIMLVGVMVDRATFTAFVPIAGYTALALFNFARGICHLRSCKLAAESVVFLVAGHVAFVFGWWAYLLGADRMGTRDPSRDRRGVC